MKIFLIGMPGSGKTTTGKLLAEELKLPFVDLDLEIEKSEGQRINQIFEKRKLFPRSGISNVEEILLLC